MDTPSDPMATDIVPTMCWQCVDCGLVHNSQSEVCPLCGAPRSVGLIVASNPNDLTESKSDAVRLSTLAQHTGETRATLLAVVLVFALGNFMVGPLMASPRHANDYLPVAITFSLFGAIFAQFGLVAIWSVLAPVDWPRRFAIGAVATFVLYGAWAAGFGIAMMGKSRIGYAEFRTVFWTGLLCLPIIALGVQLPLWIVRISRHWRICHNNPVTAETRSSPVGIRHIIVTTVIVAVALSAARCVAAIHHISAIQIIAPLLIASSAAAAASLFSTLSITIATLRAKDVWPALFVALLLNGVVFFVFLVVMSVIQRSGPPGEMYGFLFMLFVGFFGSFVTAMALIRRLGYRLYWGRDFT